MDKYPPADDYEVGRYNLATDTVADNNKWAQDNQAPLEEWLLSHVEKRSVAGSQVGSNHGFREMVARIKHVRQREARSQWYNQYRHLLK